MKAFHPNPESGGVALEYIVISIFGLLLAVGAVAIVSKATKAKLATIEQKLGIDLGLDALNPLD